MKEDFFDVLIRFMKILGWQHDKWFMDRDGLDSDDFYNTCEKWARTDTDALLSFLKTSGEVGENYKPTFKAFQKIAVIIHSEDEFFEPLTVDEMELYELVMRETEELEFEKLEKIWKKFKKGKVGFSKYARRVFRVFEAECLPYLLPLIERERYLKPRPRKIQFKDS